MAVWDSVCVASADDDDDDDGLGGALSAAAVPGNRLARSSRAAVGRL